MSSRLMGAVLTGGILALVCACDAARPELPALLGGGGGDAATAGGATGSTGLTTGGAAGLSLGGAGNGQGGAATALGGADGAAGNASAGNAGGMGNLQSPGVTPLFSEADAINPLTVSVRPDGTIVTRAAGRYRNRHEKELTFATFPLNYYEGSTFGLVIEDFTPTGVDRIRVTYLPIAAPSESTIINWRVWKESGDNAVFQFNKNYPEVTEAEVPAEGQGIQHAAVFQIEETTAPTGRSFALGENFEFELGFFIDPATAPPTHASNEYYTDCFRYEMGVGGLTPNNTDYEAASGPALPARLGGHTTIAWLFQDLEQYFGQLALNTQPENVQTFVEGRRLYFTDFITGEHQGDGGPRQDVFMEQAAKVGPMFATTACGNCHVPSAPSGDVTAMEVELYGATQLGNQLQLQEGYAALTGTETKVVALGDGTLVTLSKPVIEINLTDAATLTGFSARVAPKLIGLGLLEAISEQTLLSRADPIDGDGDGISGRPVYMQDAQTGDIRLGRFGWKAEMASIEQEAARALAEDLGVGNSLVPDSAGNNEFSDDELSDLITYLRLIGVPPQRNASDQQVMQGELLFTQVGCAGCHISDVITGPNHPFAELRDQAIRPYTDLLLHDMGIDLADDSGVAMEDGDSASPSALEWRTPPLWGLGLTTTVTPSAHFLHDGRAATILEAILWHGGEANPSIDKVKALVKADRDALLAFLDSL